MVNQPAIPAMRGVSYYVPLMAYAVDVDITGAARVYLGNPPAASAVGLLSAQSIAAAGSTTAFAAAYNTNSFGRYGRNIQVVASGAATSTVTINGTDYLGQAMTETLTLNGASIVLGLKMFRYINSISWGLTGGTTINVGWGDRLGLPYRCTSAVLTAELVSDVVPTAGAIVVGAAQSLTQTATTADPRGYYTPQAAFLADGTRTYSFTYNADIAGGLHGARHYAA